MSNWPLEIYAWMSKSQLKLNVFKSKHHPSIVPPKKTILHCFFSILIDGKSILLGIQIKLQESSLTVHFLFTTK